MIKHYLITIYRIFVQNKLFSFINVFGLALGLSCCIFILLFVKYELSFDKWLPNADNIYRYQTIFKLPNRDPSNIAKSPLLAKDALIQFFPEIKEIVNIRKTSHSINIEKFNHDGEIWFVDENFFNIFELPMVSGIKKEAFKANRTALISENISNKYFGTQMAIGKIISLGNKRDYKIVGIFKDIPDNSHFNLQVLIKNIPDDELTGTDPRRNRSWFNTDYYTYLTLKEGYSPNSINSKFHEFVDKYIPNVISPNGKSSDTVQPYLKPLTGIHLDNKTLLNIKTPGNYNTIYALLVVAFLILILGCVNFTNLSAARSQQRAREVSIRKAVGANRLQLVTQFLGESTLMSMLSFIIAILLVELLLPWYRELLNINFNINYVQDWAFFVFIFVLTIIVGIISGIYPALILSSFKPALILKSGQSYSGKNGSILLRFILVVIQFSISICIGIVAIVLVSQHNYATTKDLGFSKVNKVIINSLNHVNSYSSKSAFMNEVSRVSGVKKLAYSSYVPGDTWEQYQRVSVEGRSDEKRMHISSVWVDHNFFDVYKIPIIAGRNFSKDRAQDTIVFPAEERSVRPKFNIIINQVAVNYLGFGKPELAIGNILRYGLIDLEIVGVVHNFHFRSVRDIIRPIVFGMHPYSWTKLTVLHKENIDEAHLLTDINVIWEKFVKTHDLSYDFMVQRIYALYTAEKQQNMLVGIFSILAIFIACLGIYGLASFSTERKMKEIAIRKLHGASTVQIIKLLLWQFSKPVIIANIIAWPIGFVILLDYLNNFSYRINLDIIYFLIISLISLAIAWLTTSWHALKIANSKPVNSLRYE